MAVSSSLFSNYNGMRLELTVELVSQNIESNTSTVSYLLRMVAVNSWDYASGSGLSNAPKVLVIDGTTVVNQNQSSYSVPAGGSFTLASGTRSITHNSDGSKTLNSSGSFTGHSSLGSASVSVSLALPTIPRASSISGSHTTRLLGETLGITINRASSSFTHTVRYRVGVGSYVNIATGVTTSYNWILPNSIADSIPTSINASITLECITYNGSTEIGRTTASLTATVPNNETFKPSASITSINAVDGLNGYYVQGKSKVNALTAGAAKFSATVIQHRLTIDGLQYYGSNITSGVISKSGTVSIALRVTDSRGLFAEVTSSVIFQVYFSPKINSFTAIRNPTDQDTNLSAAVNFEIANISNQNSKLYRIRYRVPGGSWSTLFSSTSYYSRIFTHVSNGILDGNNSYEIEFFVQDSYSSATQILTVTTAFQLLNFNASGKGLALGKVSESDTFEVGMDTSISGNIVHPLQITGTAGSNPLRVRGIQGITADGTAYDELHLNFLTNNPVYINGRTAWHEGNFNPNTKADVSPLNPPNPGTTEIFVKLAALTADSNQGSNIEFIFSGGGDYGNNNRSTYLVQFAQRNGSPRLITYGFNHEGVGTGLPRFYYVSTGTYTYDIWVRLARYNYTHQLTLLNSFGAELSHGSSTTNPPAGLVYVPTRNIITNHLIRSGSVTVSPTANSPSFVTVSFGITFAEAPATFATANTTVPGSAVIEVATSNTTTTETRVYIYRNSTTSTGVDWLAVQKWTGAL